MYGDFDNFTSYRDWYEHLKSCMLNDTLFGGNGWFWGNTAFVLILKLITGEKIGKPGGLVNSLKTGRLLAAPTELTNRWLNDWMADLRE